MDRVRTPLGQLTCRTFIIHDLVAEYLAKVFQSMVGGFGINEPDDDKRDDTKADEDEVVACIDSVKKRRSNEGDNEIEKPVGARAERHALGASAKREDFGAEEPGAGAPGGAKEEQVQTNTWRGKG